MSVTAENARAAGAVVPPHSVARARWIGFRTIIAREYGRIIRIWGQTIVPSAVTATLYFVIFGSLIGKRVGAMGGFDYMQYIAPGLIMMSVITNSYGNVVSSFFGAKFQRFLEEIMVSPLPNWVIVAGYVGGGMVRGLLVGGVVTVVSFLFTDLHVHHGFVIVAAVLLTSAIFALGGFINAVFAKNFDQISWFPTFVLTPLTYLGGIFTTTLTVFRRVGTGIDISYAAGDFVRRDNSLRIGGFLSFSLPVESISLYTGGQTEVIRSDRDFFMQLSIRYHSIKF